ncbi:MAG: EAL domain-containing protein, partial [Methylophilaceae bacterium]|nr:EAL domain-containing protein [Methylophilaceae bacterium]
FALRIAGLIVIIVIFVTAGTMFVTSQLVLMPILQLRRSLFSLAEDPDNIENYHIKSNAQGEMNDILSAHNTMLTEVANSRRLDKERAEERASFSERHDPLTQLPNRKLFLEHLSKVLVDAKDSETIIRVLVINFSDFRLINDAYGQNFSNQLLISTAKKLDAMTSSNSFVARLDTDEFAITNTDSGGLDQAATLAGHILAVCANPLMIDGMSFNLHPRIGIACSSDNRDAEYLLQNAKTALNILLDNPNSYEKYRFYASDMTKLRQQKQEIERDLRHAINHNQLSLFYQPKMTLNYENSVCTSSSCEALIRWHHPTKGLLSPGEFIPIAEKSELIFSLGEWVLSEACMQIKLWRKAGFVVPRVAVNLSVRQFLDPKLPELVSDIIKNSGVNADDLELEITESAAMSDIQTSIMMLEKLRQIGVRLSIDDFGTGHSSLGYLQQLKVNSLKIDKIFIDGIDRDEDANIICDAIIRLGQSLGLKIIAEGVESNTQLDFLRERHCDEVQGFLFAHPMSSIDLTKELKLGAHE